MRRRMPWKDARGDLFDHPSTTPRARRITSRQSTVSSVDSFGAMQPPMSTAALPFGRKVPPADAFVFFGATGDLAHKKIFPSLLALLKRGRLDMPIVCV